jgi:predicted alpha/beta hydrolase family esterase
VTTNVVFIQGAGAGAHEADRLLADSLRASLGPEFEVRYPEMVDGDEPELGPWSDQIDHEIETATGNVIVIGHSVGASIVLKHLSEGVANPRIVGVFLVAAPSWGADDFWAWEEGTLDPAAAGQLAGRMPVVLYHSVDDEEVPFSHLARNAAHVPGAISRELETGGHQFGNDLGVVARDIRTIVEGGVLR